MSISYSRIIVDWLALSIYNGYINGKYSRGYFWIYRDYTDFIFNLTKMVPDDTHVREFHIWHQENRELLKIEHDFFQRATGYRAQRSNLSYFAIVVRQKLVIVHMYRYGIFKGENRQETIEPISCAPPAGVIMAW